MLPVKTNGQDDGQPSTQAATTVYGKTKQRDSSLLDLVCGVALFAVISVGIWLGFAYLIESPRLAVWGSLAIAAGWIGFTICGWRDDRNSGEGQVDGQGYRHGTWVWRGDDEQIDRQVDYHHGDIHGTLQTYHNNGQRAVRTLFAQGKRDGLSTTWNQLGVKTFEGEFIAGLPHGTWTWWHDNGQRQVQGDYIMGTPHGQWTAWDERGELQRQMEYIAGVQHGAPQQFFAHHSWEYDFHPPVPPPGTGFKRLFWTLFLGVLIAAFARDMFLLVPLAVLLFVIAVHELGHFLAAKLVGIPIRQFCVGVGPRWFTRLRRGTVYELGIVPLMGYVREEELRQCEWDHARAVLRARQRGEPEPPYPEIEPEDPRQPGAHLVGPIPRLVFYLGGVAANFLLAACILWGLGRAEGTDVGPIDAVLATAKFAGAVAAYVPEDLLGIVEIERYTEYEPSIFTDLSQRTREAIATPATPDGSPAAEGASPNDTWSARLANAGSQVLFFLFAVNVGMMVFNLLPLPPLDGFRCVVAMFEMFVGPNLARRAATPFYVIGGILLVLLILSGCYFIGRDLVRTILP